MHLLIKISQLKIFENILPKLSHNKNMEAFLKCNDILPKTKPEGFLQNARKYRLGSFIKTPTEGNHSTVIEP